MQTSKRVFMALAAAGAGALFLSSGAMAAGNHGSNPGHGAAQASSTSSGCDVPGKSCDPTARGGTEKTDNGVGNNCDPGYGRGNQAKFPPDESTSTCRTQPESGSNQPEGSTQSGQNEQPEQSGQSQNAERPQIVTEKNELLGLEKIALESNEGTFTLTVVVTGSNGTAPETFTVVVNGNHVTINGQELQGNVEETIEGLLARLEANGTISLGNTGGELMVGQLPGGGFTITLPNGTVLTFTGGVLASGATTIPTGQSGEISGVQVSNGTAPTSTTAPSGHVLANSATAPGSGTGLGLAANAAMGAASGLVSAATGTPLAATGLPILGGLAGLLMVGFGLIARRRG